MYESNVWWLCSFPNRWLAVIPLIIRLLLLKCSNILYKAFIYVFIKITLKVHPKKHSEYIFLFEIRIHIFLCKLSSSIQMLFCTTILVPLVLIPLISGHMTSHSRYDGAWMWYTHIQRCLDVKLARAGLFVDEVFIHMTVYSSLATISVVFLSSFPCFVERSKFSV